MYENSNDYSDEQNPRQDSTKASYITTSDLSSKDKFLEPSPNKTSKFSQLNNNNSKSKNDGNELGIQPYNDKIDDIQTSSIDDFQKKVEAALLKGTYEDNQNLERGHSTQTQEKSKKEDPKFDEIKSVLGDEIVQNLSNSKWEQKKQGFEDINNFLQNSSSYFKGEDLFAYMKFKLKDFKESNFNVIKEAINVFILMIQKKLIKNDLSLSVLNAYYDKYGDMKLKEKVHSLIMSLVEYIPPVNVIKSILNKLMKKPQNKLLQEYSSLFGKFIEDYDVMHLPIKEMVDLCKLMASNSNQQVRTAAISLLCVLYKYIGKDIKMLIKDIKESTLKIIEAEFEKITVISPEQKKPKKEVPKEEDDTPAPMRLLDGELIPRSDISKKITNGMLKDIKDGKWPEKKEACEAIEKILLKANMKILPDGLDELFNVIKSKLSDRNKNLVRMMVLLVGKLIESLGQGFKQYTKQIAPAMLPSLSDKTQILRDDIQSCLDKWVQYVGIDTIVIFIPHNLKNNNVEVRIEQLKFIKRHKDKFTNSIGESFFKEIASSLLTCLQDKSGPLRAIAEDIVIFSFQFISVNTYYKELKDFKPVVASCLKENIDKLKEDVENPCSSRKISNSDNGAKKPQSVEKRQEEIKVIKKNKHQLSNENINKENNKRRVSNREIPNQNQNQIPIPIPIPNPNVNKSATRGKVIPRVDKKNIKKGQIFLDNPNVKPNKEKRIEIDKRYKFSIDAINADFINKLKEQLKGLFTEEYCKKIFTDEFKSVSDGLNMLKKSIDEEENTVIIIDNLDLILKLLGAKFGNNQNPTMTKSFLIFLDSLSSLIFSNSYQMNETEINIVIFTCIEKLSLSNKGLKDHLVKILLNYINIIGCNKATLIALNCGLYKSPKIKTEVLDIVADLLLSGNIDISNRQYARVFSKYLAINDYAIKNKTLFFFKEIYSKIGDELWSYIDLNEKDRDFLESNLEQDQDQEKVEEEGQEQEMEEEESEKEENENEEENDEENDNSDINNGNSNNNEYNSVNTNNNNYYNYNTNQNFFSNNTHQEQVHKIVVLKKNAQNVQKVQNAQNIQNVQENGINGRESQTGQIVFNTNGNIKDKNELTTTLNNLLTNDPTERVNTIIIIHELICTKYEDNKVILIQNIDFIIQIFVQAMRNLFSVGDITTIPIKFAKYLVTVLCKIASNKELIFNITYNVLLKLSEELLSNLLIENLVKIGTNQEGNIIFKSLNSTMLRILENCNSTYVILSLLDLIHIYRTNEEKSKLAGLAVKCLLKVNQNLEVIISSLNNDKILLQIHILLVNFELTNPDLNPTTQTDQIVLKYIKNLLNEMVKFRGNEILNDYNKGVKLHSTPDKYILKWIKSCLGNSQKDNGAINGTNENCPNKEISKEDNVKNKTIKMNNGSKVNRPNSGVVRPTPTMSNYNSSITDIKKKLKFLKKSGNEKKK